MNEKPELFLDINLETGLPMIYIKHFDKSTAIEQKILKLFIDNGLKRGLEIVSISGFLEVGTDNSHENYQIRIMNHQSKNVLQVTNDEILFSSDEMRKAYQSGIEETLIDLGAGGGVISSTDKKEIENESQSWMDSYMKKRNQKLNKLKGTKK